YEITGTSPKEKGSEVPFPQEPAPGAAPWSVANMIHEVGLPAPQDPVQSIADWIVHWSKLYDATVTEPLVKASFSDWNSLRLRTPLNERDSLFGIAYRTRTRASGGGDGDGDSLLGPSLRRAKEASIDDFISRLKFGIPLPGGDPFDIGNVWDNPS